MQAPRTEYQQVTFGNAIKALGIVRRSQDGLGKFLASNGRNLKRLLLGEKLAKQPEEGGHDMGSPGRGDVALVDAAHPVPDDSIHLQRMRQDLCIRAFTISHAHDRGSPTGFQGFAHGANTILQPLHVGFSLANDVQLQALELPLMNNSVSGSSEFQREDLLVGTGALTEQDSFEAGSSGSQPRFTRKALIEQSRFGQLLLNSLQGGGLDGLNLRREGIQSSRLRSGPEVNSHAVGKVLASVGLSSDAVHPSGLFA